MYFASHTDFALFKRVIDWDNFSHWLPWFLFHLSFSSIVRLYTFLLSTWFTILVPIFMSGFSGNCFSFLSDTISMNSVLLIFGINFFASSQLLILFRSLLILLFYHKLNFFDRKYYRHANQKQYWKFCIHFYLDSYIEYEKSLLNIQL